MQVPTTFELELPKCTWLVWRSASLEQVWRPRIAQCRNAIREIEILSVICGFRRAALVSGHPSALFAGRLVDVSGLTVVNLSIASGDADSVVRNKSSFVVARTRDAQMILGALALVEESTNHERIGEILGFPRCCRSAFRRYYVERKSKDPTWEMAQNSDSQIYGRTAVLNGYDEVNVLLWWLGVRAICHRPCSFSCIPSAQIGRRLLEIGARFGYHTQVAHMREMLSWPAEWSSCNGLVQIDTPILRIYSRNADPTDHTLLVRRTSRGWASR